MEKWWYDDKKELAAAIQRSVEWLQEKECGCCTLKLDERLAVCVGWMNGYDIEDNFMIHSKEEPEWAIVAGILVWTSDDLRTDYEWISYPYYENTGETWDTTSSISPNEDYEQLADYFFSEYAEMEKYEIDKSGKIIGLKETEEEVA